MEKPIMKSVKKICLAGLVTLLAAAMLAAEAPTVSDIAKTASPKIQGAETAVLTFAPNVPPPLTRKHATKVTVNLEVIEVTRRLADGVDYVFWTFGGDVPGKFIRIRV